MRNTISGKMAQFRLVWCGAGPLWHLFRFGFGGFLRFGLLGVAPPAAFALVFPFHVSCLAV
jgi:hypothetical protein